MSKLSNSNQSYRQALVGGPIWSEWLVLFCHWSVDFWLMDWLANRISATFFIFGRPAISLCLEFHSNTCNTFAWLIHLFLELFIFPTGIIYQIVFHSQLYTGSCLDLSLKSWITQPDFNMDTFSNWNAKTRIKMFSMAVQYWTCFR